MTKRLITTAAFVCGAILIAVQVASAQTEGLPSISVESNEVLVRVFVFDKKIMTSPLPSVKFLYAPVDDEIRDLTARDFHLLEDGKEQKIQSVMWSPDYYVVNVRDNMGYHDEISVDTPKGIWSTEPTPTPSEVLGHADFSVNPGHFYLVAYVPSESPQGSCHAIEIKVDHPNSFVFARSEYCNVKHSSSDPLNGTAFGRQLEDYAASGKTGKIRLSFQTNVFYRDSKAGLADIAIEFPTDSLSREWTDKRLPGLANLTATIGILGMVRSKKDGTLAARFSSIACCSDEPIFGRGQDPALGQSLVEPLVLPARYETQVDLPPGEYDLVVVLSDGKKFGRFETSVTVDSFEGKELAISSVMLCKRFRDAGETAQEAAAFHLAPQYVPLVSKGVQFTPTGDTSFGKGEPLFAYFEVYEPLLTGAPPAAVQVQLKITNVKTGELKVDTGSRSAGDWIQPGKTVIPIAEQIAVDKLPKGSYRLEVQATDSTGKSTVRRSANFTVD